MRHERMSTWINNKPREEIANLAHHPVALTPIEVNHDLV
jgi:hypothetical protein